MNELTENELAAVLYETYCAGVGGVAFNGDPLPNAEEFFSDPSKEKQAGAWIESARAAIQFAKERMN